MTTEDTNAPEGAETEATGTDSNNSKISSSTTPRVGLHSMLTRDSDMASRPGFRNPSNKRSKAQTGAKKAKAKLKVKRKKGKKKR